MRHLLSLLLFACTVPSSAIAAAESAAPPPNIIFVLFDDMGFAEPPCYNGASKFKMPHFDRLTSQGVRFTDAHSASSVCTPTRYGVMTGRYPWRIGQFGVLGPWGEPVIDSSRLTVAAMLRDKGYHTACIGKWHLGMMPGKEGEAGATGGKGKGKPGGGDLKPGDLIRSGPLTRGFDAFLGYNAARGIGQIVENEKFHRSYDDVAVQPMLARRAVEHIDARAKEGKPFFLYLPLSPPHTPHVPAPEFDGKTGLGKHGDWLMQGDWVLGQIIDALDRNKLAQNTLIIVTSDNGSPHVANVPLRGKKTQIWEGGHRVPFIARWPGIIKPSSVSDERIGLTDLMATCADVAGVKLPDNAAEDSISILPVLRGTPLDKPLHDTLVAQSMAGDVAIYHGPWKLIFPKKGGRELYNLADDLAESKDLAASQGPVVEKLTGLMEKLIRDGRSTPGPAQKTEHRLVLPRP